MTALLFISLLTLGIGSSDETVAVSDTLRESVAISSYKTAGPSDRLASVVTSVYMADIERRALQSTKDFSAIVPNLHIPDYGSSMTSSVYMRGFGSRMDNPVVGLYVDDIPVMNKNNYDFDMLDIRRADVLRGPQGTLYGRNAMCGVLLLSTLSPESWHGGRAAVEYGAANSVLAKAAWYGDVGKAGKAGKNAFVGVSAGYRHSSGWYYNDFTGKRCDPMDSFSLRLRLAKRLRANLKMENIMSASFLKQGGWPYRLLDEASGELLPVSYNDVCAYERMSFTDGLKFRLDAPKVVLCSVTSYQLLWDKMDLDQDFTPSSMFTLRQIQRESAVTQEFVLTPSQGGTPSWWNWQTGAFLFGKYNAMSAPVRFLEDGIRELILDGANANIPEEFGRLEISETSFPIGSEFGLLTLGAAAYHESYFSVGRWMFTAGVRLDYEFGRMAYDSSADIHYRLTNFPDFRPFQTSYRGAVSKGYFEVVPKVAVSYTFGSERGSSKGNVFGLVSKGYKSGGFNTQIFSDILQNMMMTGMMEDLGVYLDEESAPVTADNATYAPEYSYNYEVGGDFSASLGGGGTLRGSASVFFIDCRNQQITMFPPGKSTGRMMANVGRSRSIGAEAELYWTLKGLSVSASGGYTDARFVKYDDGRNDYSGNKIPYSPESTVMVRAGYMFSTKSDIFRSLSVAADFRGTGRIAWDEANNYVQPFKGFLGCDVSFGFKWFDLRLRCDNITGTDYDVFYFRSVGNSFFQRGKPFRWNIGIFCDF